jgi:hypothetical protein
MLADRWHIHRGAKPRRCQQVCRTSRCKAFSAGKDCRHRRHAGIGHGIRGALTTSCRGGRTSIGLETR